MKPITSGAPKKASVIRGKFTPPEFTGSHGYKELPDAFQHSPVRKQEEDKSYNHKAYHRVYTRYARQLTKRPFYTEMKEIGAMHVGETITLKTDPDKLHALITYHRQKYPNADMEFWIESGQIMAKCHKV